MFHLSIRHHLILAAGFVLVASPEPSYAESPIPPDQAIAIIKTLEAQQESQIRNAQWKMGGFSGKVADMKNLDRILPEKLDPKVYVKDSVWFDPPTGRYRHEQEGVVPWIEGFDPYEASVEVSTFDGKTERWYKRGQGGVQDEQGRAVRHARE